ncbi:MAG: hypothetical protein R2771_00835 [Saprospiraceae bacterium]
MVYLFGQENEFVFFVESKNNIDPENISKLNWLFESPEISKSKLEGQFIGPRK